MITKKHLFFAIAATCLLTTFLFGVVPIRSAGYDPTLDVNHDGKIDGKDIALPASSYGTAGDPTVPVNVTNWPTNQPYLIQTVSLNCTFTSLYNDTAHGFYYYYGYSTTSIIYVGGYSQMCIYLIPPKPNAINQYAISNYNVTHTVDTIYWSDDASASFAAYEGASLFTSVNVNTPSSPPLTTYYIQAYNPIQVKLPYIHLIIGSQTLPGDQPGWMNMTVEIYLRND